jgi:hypothetical protein
MTVEVMPPQRGDTGERSSMGTDTAAADLLDFTARNDLRALRAALRVSQAVSGTALRRRPRGDCRAISYRAGRGLVLNRPLGAPPRRAANPVMNVGELGPGEERLPRDVQYPLAEYQQVTELLRQGRP